MRQALIAGVFVLSGIGSAADSLVIPLVDPADPIRIVSARMEFVDEIHPVMLVEIENETEQPVDSNQVWLHFARFYTKGEMDRAGNRKVWDCATIGTAGLRQPLRVIAPGARVTVLETLSCDSNRDHEHFFVEVTRVGNSSSPWFKRRPDDFVRLLNAAMPHD